MMNSDADLGSAAPIVELPALPDPEWKPPAMQTACVGAAAGIFPIETRTFTALSTYPVSMYTADQMRAYAQQAVIAERERCARIVEGERLHDQTGSDGDAGYELAITHCAAAIRAVAPHP